MYITLYNRHIHPGVNMVLEMGHLDNSDDKSSIEAAAEDVKKWASTASDNIECLVNEVCFHTTYHALRHLVHEACRGWKHTNATSRNVCKSSTYPSNRVRGLRHHLSS